MKKAILLYLAILCSPALHGDDGSYSIMGKSGAVIPIKNKSITMEKEDIRINVGIERFGTAVAIYDCTFFFTNTANSSQKAIIGFPYKLNENVHYDFSHDEGEIVTPAESPVSDFTFEVNGKSKSFLPMRAKDNPELKDVPAYDVIYATEIEFKPKEKKTIRNTFRMYYYIYGYLNTDLMHMPRGFDTIVYILKTGLTWKGTIGVADITIQFDTPRNFFAFSASPNDFLFQADPERLIYHYTDFSPKSDISVTLKYKKMPADYCVKQIREYVAKNDFLNAYYLLLKTDTQIVEKDTEAKDALRTLAYKVAEHYFRTDQDKAIALYISAFRNCRSYQNGSIEELFYPSEEFVKKYDFANWEHEQDASAPGYYIAYNLACIYSMTGHRSYAKIWYDIALLMNDTLASMAEKDKDLEYLIKGKETNIIREDADTTLLMKAIKEGTSDKKEIMHLIETSEDINSKDKKGATALMYAANESNNQKYIQAIIASGGNVNITDNEGKTPLMWACRGISPSKEMIETFIMAGANINARDKKWETPLFHLFESRGNFNATGFKEMVRYMIQEGADPDLRDLRGFNAYDIAKLNGRDYVFNDHYEPFLKQLGDKRIMIGSRDPDVQWSSIKDCKLKGNRLFFLYAWGWLVLDLSSLPKITLAEEIYLGFDRQFYKFDISGDYLYAATKETGHIYVYKITDLAKPEEKNDIVIQGYGRQPFLYSLVIINEHLCVSANEGYKANSFDPIELLNCYDLHDPENPQVAYYNVPCGTLESCGGFLVMNTKDLLLMSIAQNANIRDRVYSTVPSPEFDPMYTDGNTILLSRNGITSAYRIENQFNSEIIKIGELSQSKAVRKQDFFIAGNVIIGNIAYLRGFGCFIDISDWNNPKYILPQTGEPGLFLTNSIVCRNYVISVDDNSDIRIYDFHDTMKPVLVTLLSRR